MTLQIVPQMTWLNEVTIVEQPDKTVNRYLNEPKQMAYPRSEFVTVIKSPRALSKR